MTNGYQDTVPAAVDGEALTRPPYEPATSTPESDPYRLADLAIYSGVVFVLMGCAMWMPDGWVEAIARFFWAAMTLSF